MMLRYVAGRLQLVSSAPSEQSWTLSQIWCSVIHLPSTHRSSPLGQGDVCECGIDTKTYSKILAHGRPINFTMAKVLNLWLDDYKTLGGMQRVVVLPILTIFTS